MMSFIGTLWSRYFRRSDARTAPSTVQTPAALLTEIQARAAPCVWVIAGEGGDSWLGGAPEMAGDWPRYEGRPLGFVAQIDLRAVRTAGGPDWLPTDGRLLFFYEAEYGAWGLYPKDRGSFAVRFETGEAARATPPADLAEHAQFDQWPVTFKPAFSYPDQERFPVNWQAFTREDEDVLEAGLMALGRPEPAHQIGGYADAIQSDTMEQECDRVTSGLFDGPPGGGPADWRLLLQIDTDNDAGIMWGDTGRLYFWIREQDARAGDFSRVWMILQCF